VVFGKSKSFSNPNFSLAKKSSPPRFWPQAIRKPTPKNTRQRGTSEAKTAARNRSKLRKKAEGRLRESEKEFYPKAY